MVNNLIALFFKYVFIPLATLLGLAFRGRYVELLEEKTFSNMIVFAISIIGNMARLFLSDAKALTQEEIAPLANELAKNSENWRDVPESLHANKKFALIVISELPIDSPDAEHH